MTAVCVAPGAGRVARRGHGLLFLPVQASPVARAFLDAGDMRAARAAATSAVIATGFDGDPFALVTWDDGLHVIVFGDVEVRTDLAELPMVSGAGSTTWVEHRVADHTGVVTLEAGEPAAADTDVVDGIVPASGFRASVPVGPRMPPAAAAAGAPSPPRDEPSPDRSVGERPATPAQDARPMSSEPTADAYDDQHDEVTIPAPVTAADSGAGTPEAPRSSAGTDPVVDASAREATEPPTVPPRIAGVAALEAATEGDWMEESLGLGGVSRREPPPQPDAPSDPVEGAQPPQGDDTDGVPGTRRGPDSPAPAPAEAEAEVASQPCPAGHANRPGAARCRICSELIPPDAPTISVPQPVLGVVVLPDGSTSPLDATLVIGRRPHREAARVDSTARLIALDDSDTVSRTHLVLRPEGWAISVVDCGSTSGTAVVEGTDDEPVVLDPWITHEVTIGATIYVGGPTKVTITPLAPASQEAPLHPPAPEPARDATPPSSLPPPQPFPPPSF